jgi:hypothetical protein
MFIGQSLRSDYCAVYATGMALSLAGYPTDRRRAMALFGASPGWSGASHQAIAEAIKRATRSSVPAWQHSPKSGGALTQWMRDQLAGAAGAPLVITAWCRHRLHRVTCGHAFVATGIEENSLLLLDPLGPRPADRSNFNARISASTSARWLHPTGTSWDICAWRGASALTVHRRSGETLPADPLKAPRCSPT